MNDFTELYINEKPVKALLMVYYSEDETFCQEISNNIDSTYSHTVKIVSKLKELGILNTRDQGRKKMLSLSSKGERQAVVFESLLNELEDSAENKRERLEDKGVFR